MQTHKKAVPLSARMREAWRSHRALWIVLACAVLIGGGGRGATIANLVVQLVALVILAVNLSEVRSVWRRTPMLLKAAIGASLALPLIQVIPLPPSVWTRLPGRDLVQQSLALIGESDRWMPISVAPMVTLLAATAFVAPFAVFSLASNLNRVDRLVALKVIIGLGLIAVMLGAVQLATGNTIGNLYSSRNPAYLYGTFANHNAIGLFLVIALLASIEIAMSESLSRTAKGWAWAVGVLLLLGTLLTQSRSSIALLLIPAVFLVYRALQARRADSASPRKSQRRKNNWIIGAILVAVLGLSAGAAYTFLGNNVRIAQTMERFKTMEDARPELWADATYSVERFWPVGSGMGTFDEVFQLDESLESLYPQRAGRAHNDYLELLVESGAAGVLVLLIWLLYFALRAFGRLGSKDDRLIFISCVLGAIALQSLVDYPLRNQAMLCVAALMVGLLNARTGSGREGKNRVEDS